MAGFKAKIESVKGHLPRAIDFRLPVELWEEIGWSIADGVVGNIRRGQKADGTMLKQNAKSTAIKKFHETGKVKPLVYKKDRFITKGNYFVKADKGGVTVKTGYTRISRFVQGKGFVGWLGVSKDRWKIIRKMIADWLRTVTASKK